MASSGSTFGVQQKARIGDWYYKVNAYKHTKENYSEVLVYALYKAMGININYFTEYRLVDENTCRSKYFLRENDIFMTASNFLEKYYGSDQYIKLKAKIKTSSVLDGIKLLLGTFNEVENKEFLFNMFFIDSIILNEDRHFKNFGVIVNNNKIKLCPVWDNGYSLLTTSEITLINKVRLAKSSNGIFLKPFEKSANVVFKELEPKVNLTLNWGMFLSSIPDEIKSSEEFYVLVARLIYLLGDKPSKLRGYLPVSVRDLV